MECSSQFNSLLKKQLNRPLTTSLHIYNYVILAFYYFIQFWKKSFLLKVNIIIINEVEKNVNYFYWQSPQLAVRVNGINALPL